MGQSSTEKVPMSYVRSKHHCTKCPPVPIKSFLTNHDLKLHNRAYHSKQVEIIHSDGSRSRLRRADGVFTCSCREAFSAVHPDDMIAHGLLHSKSGKYVSKDPAPDQDPTTSAIGPLNPGLVAIAKDPKDSAIVITTSPVRQAGHDAAWTPESSTTPSLLVPRPVVTLDNTDIVTCNDANTAAQAAHFQAGPTSNADVFPAHETGLGKTCQKSTRTTDGPSASLLNSQLYKHDLFYLIEWKVLVCVICKTGIAPTERPMASSVHRHFQSVHGAKRTQQEQAALTELIADLEYVRSHDLQRLLPCLYSPIPVLQLLDGFSCILCHYNTRNVRQIQVHRQNSHPQSTVRLSYFPCKVQCFFRTPAMWFRVNAGIDLTQPPDDLDDTSLAVRRSIVAELQESETSFTAAWARQLNRVSASTQGQTRSPFLTHMNWTQMFLNADMQARSMLVELPSSDDPIYSAVLSALDAFFHETCLHMKSMSSQVSHLLRSKTNEAVGHPWQYIQEDTFHRYLNSWKQFVCFMLRVGLLKDTMIASLKITIPGALGIAIANVHQLLNASSDSQQPSLQFQQAIAKLCHASILYEVASSTNSQPIHNFLGHCAWRRFDNRFMSPIEYRNIGAGMIWCSRTVFYNFIFLGNDRVNDQATDNGVTQLKFFKAEHQRLMTESSLSPMADLYARQAYSKSAGISTAVLRKAWIETNNINLDSIKIPIDGLFSMIHTLVVEANVAASQLLQVDLSFCTENFLSQLTDNIGESKNGYSFLDEPSNRELLSRHVALQDYAASEYTICDAESPSGYIWNEYKIGRYCTQVMDLLSTLWVLIHITSGQPARGPEICSIQYMNSAETLRHIFMIDGRFILVTNYTKSQSLTGQAFFVCRTPPFAVARILFLYLALIRPFLRKLQWRVSEELLYSHSGYVFCELKNSMTSRHNTDTLEAHFWTTPKVSEILRKLTQRHMGVSITISDWRHIAIALARHYGELDFSGKLGDEDEQEVDLAVAQAGHGSGADAHYAVNPTLLKSLNPQLVKGYTTLSIKWHEILGFKSSPLLHLPQASNIAAEIYTGVSTPRSKRAMTETLQMQTPLFNGRAAPGSEFGTPTAKSRRVLSTPSRNQVDLAKASDALQTLTGASCFKSKDQEDAYNLITQQLQHIVVVLQTGAGKSLLYQLTAYLSAIGSMTLVIIPFIALLREAYSRTSKMMPSHLYDRSSTNMSWMQRTDLKLVFVSADEAVTDDFLDMFSQLKRTGRLVRMFVDEAHVALFDDTFRTRIAANISQLQRLEVQTVLLSATLPPSMENEIYLKYAIAPEETLWLHGSVDRCNIRYCVQKVSGQTVQDSSALNEIKAYLDKFMPGLTPRDRVLIYVQSVKVGEKAADCLGCAFYHAKEETKHEIYGDWCSARHGQVLIATSALTHGVDYPHVRLIVHIGAPNSLQSFVQECGRAGRDSVIATSIVFYCNLPTPQAGQGSAAHDIYTYLSAVSCRRAIVNAYLQRATIASLPCLNSGGQLCDNCQVGTGPVDLISQTQSTSSVTSNPLPKQRAPGCNVQLSSVFAQLNREMNRPDDAHSVHQQSPEVPPSSRPLASNSTRYSLDSDDFLQCRSDSSLTFLQQVDQVKAQAERDVIDRLQKFDRLCMYCVVARCTSSKHHWPRSCPHNHINSALLATLQKEKFANYSCCFLCKCPQKVICSRFSAGVPAANRKCEFADIVMPAVCTALTIPLYQKDFMEFSGHQMDLQDFDPLQAMRFLTRKVNWLNHQASNAWLFFLRILTLLSDKDL